MTVFPDVIDIDYNAMVSFDFYQKCFMVLEVQIIESFCPKGHENLCELRRLSNYGKSNYRELTVLRI